MGPLAFAARSHRFEGGRDLEISDESEARIREMLQAQNFTYVEEPYELGEVSFDSGWTFHRAGGNSSAQARAVMTIIYMEDGIRLIKPRNNHQQQDWKAWLPGCKIGEIVNSEAQPCALERMTSTAEKRFQDLVEAVVPTACRFAGRLTPAPYN